MNFNILVVLRAIDRLGYRLSPVYPLSTSRILEVNVGKDSISLW